MNDIVNHPKNSKTTKKNSIKNITDVKKEIHQINTENIHKKKKLLNNIISPSYKINEVDAKTQSDSRNINTIKVNDLNTLNENNYKQISRPTNKFSNNPVHSLNNNMYHYKNNSDKLINLDILEHTGNSFVNPETEDINKSKNDIDPIKIEEQEIVNEEINKTNEKKQNKTYNSISTNTVLKNFVSSNKDIEDIDLEKTIYKLNNKQIGYHFQSSESKKENINNKNNKNNNNYIFPEIDITSKNIEYLKNLNGNNKDVIDRGENWDNKSFSHNLKKPEKINVSVLSNVSYKSTKENNKLRIKINNGIIDINQYENEIISTKNNIDSNAANCTYDSKDNCPINFISSVKNNFKFKDDTNYENYIVKDSPVLDDYYKNLSNEKRSTNNQYYKKDDSNKKINIPLIVKIGETYSSNYLSNINDANGGYLNDIQDIYKDASNAKQETLEYQISENQGVLRETNDLNKNILDNEDISKIKKFKQIEKSNLFINFS